MVEYIVHMYIAYKCIEQCVIWDAAMEYSAWVILTVYGASIAIFGTTGKLIQDE